MRKNKTLLITVPLMLLLLAGLAYRYGYVRVAADLASLKEQQEVKAMSLAKHIALIAEKPVIEKKMAALKDERKADESKLIEGQTPALAAATLQDIVKGIITGHGGSISSERVGKPEDLGNFRTVNVTIDAVLPDVRALSETLYSIETRTPHLVIKELDARVRNFREPRELLVKMDIVALTGRK